MDEPLRPRANKISRNRAEGQVWPAGHSVLTPSASLVSRKGWSPKFMQVVGWIQFHSVHELNLSFWETGFNPPHWGRSMGFTGRLWAV